MSRPSSGPRGVSAFASVRGGLLRIHGVLGALGSLAFCLVCLIARGGGDHEDAAGGEGRDDLALGSAAEVALVLIPPD